MSEIQENSTGMIVDGIGSDPSFDSSGESLDLEGANIDDLIDGKGLFSYEHKGAGGDDESYGQEIVGKVLGAKKIFKASDCENERHKFYFERNDRRPYLYIIGRLFDGAGHAGAQAIAAAVRDAVKNKEPMVISYSVEGSTLKKEGPILKRTLIRRVAITWKPCLKTTELGLVEDPHAPAGYEKNPNSTDIASLVNKKEFDPQYQRLGGSSLEYGSEMLKTMIAGNYNVAPGALTGGAALQREDRGLKANALAAYRDWDRVTPFKKFLKARLPDVSEEFLNHYTDIVDKQSVRLKKAQEVLSELAKAGKTPAKPKAKKEPAPPKESSYTVQGVPVLASPQGAKAGFANGVLTTRKGLFAASTPSNPHPALMAKTGLQGPQIAQHFSDALQEQRGHHQRAMANWFRVNDKFSKGDIDPGVVAHAVAFALMSPGVKVPLQEIQYGHLIDALHSQGQTVPTADRWDETFKNFMSRNRTGLPEHSRSHFVGLMQDPHTRAAIANSEGAMTGFNKPNKFNEYFGEYLRNHHNQVVESIRDSKGDAHQVARKLTEVRGIAPKLSRYLLGMMGAGNMVVPDTHFLRHYFGTQPVAPGRNESVDSDTQNHLKQTVLGSTASHDILEGIDKHYFENHDAVKHVLADPTIGPYFKGREKQANFPAFWWHWIATKGHENRIGTPNGGAVNAGTDHAPFWDAVNPMLKSEGGGYDEDLPQHTALQHHRWIEQYGPVQALGLHYRYLVPKLLENDAKKPAAMVMKFEELQVDILNALRKSDIPAPEHWKALQEKPSTVSVKEHGVGDFNYHPDHAKVADGLNLDGHNILKTPDSTRERFNSWKRSPTGKVFVKKEPSWMPTHDENYPETHQEGAYSNLARDFFGLGQYVPTVSVVKHPKDGSHHAIIEHREGTEYDPTYEPHANVMKNLADSGEIDKIHFMDNVMGNLDRHSGNSLVDPTHGLSLIDHNMILPHELSHASITSAERLHGVPLMEAPHPAAIEWAKNLKSDELEAQLRRHEVPDKTIRFASERLKQLQKHLTHSPNDSRALAWTRPLLATNKTFQEDR